MSLMPADKLRTPVVIASDHAGFELKSWLVQSLTSKGEHEPWRLIDLGTNSPEPDDYPDRAIAVGRAIQGGVAGKGILICGSGVGASVAVNKIDGIRAGLCHDSYSAHQGVEHDDMNVLVLGAWVVSTRLANELARFFLNAIFSAEDRHVRRLAKITLIEKGLL